MKLGGIEATCMAHLLTRSALAGSMDLLTFDFCLSFCRVSAISHLAVAVNGRRLHILLYDFVDMSEDSLECRCMSAYVYTHLLLLLKHPNVEKTLNL